MRVLASCCILLSVGVFASCASGGDASPSPGSGGVGAFGGAPSGGSGGKGGTGATGGSSTGGGGSGGTDAATGGTAGSTTGGAAGATGGSAGSTGTGGNAGAGGAPPGWPTCDAQPSGVPSKTIPQVWADDASTATEVWIPGTYITAISGGACVTGQTCQIFLQQDESYSSFSAGAKHAIHVRISANAALHFLGLGVGDKVDALGWGWRSNLNGNNEMVLQVNSQLQGCLKKVGSGNPVPVNVTYTDLSVNAYEQTTGPLLVDLATVTGKPGQPTEIFGLWKTGVGIGDAGPESLVNLSPYFLPNNKFTGLTPSATTNFTSVSGVFAVFVPIVEGGVAPKYVVIYPRSMSELVP